MGSSKIVLELFEATFAAAAAAKGDTFDSTTVGLVTVGISSKIEVEDVEEVGIEAGMVAGGRRVGNLLPVAGFALVKLGSDNNSPLVV